jgi:hypothetical protein
MRRSGAALTLALTAAAATAVVAAPARARAGENLDALLGGLGPAPPRATVKVLGWVERAGGGDELVISFVPEGGVKLVADPGITVTPEPRDGVTWSGNLPLNHAQPGLDYFPAPVTLRLPFTGADGRPVAAAVEYAYCIVAQQCLFDTARVSAGTEPGG